MAIYACSAMNVFIKGEKTNFSLKQLDSFP